MNGNAVTCVIRGGAAVCGLSQPFACPDLWLLDVEFILLILNIKLYEAQPIS